MVRLIAGIAASQEQGLRQISKAAAEMNKVVQLTAAIAEESAGAAEEMSAQSQQMKIYFKI